MRSKLAVKFPASSRIAIFLAASALLCATEMLPTRALPQFSDYPFDEWAAAPEHSSIKWEVHLLPAQLSVHERLIERVQVVVPGGELAKRRGRGELILLTRFEDSEGRQWRTGSRMSLVHIQPGVKGSELTFTTAAFVKPGDYRLSLALADSHTMEHNFTRRTLHIAALKGDSLPDSWTGLPTVEIIQGTEGPDSWFLPGINSLLKLPLRNPSEPPIMAGAVAGAVYPEAAVYLASAKVTLPRATTAAYPLPRLQSPEIELLVNATPSERSGGSAGALRRNMSAVIPALKVLSGLNAKVHSPSAAVMDLTHHRIGFETSDAASLDWNALGTVLKGMNPGIIDAKALAGESSMRNYFSQEIVRRAGESGPPRWLIVMSGPFSFSTPDATPLPQLAPDPNRHIVYLRFLPGFGWQGGAFNSGQSMQIAPVLRVHGPMPGLGTVIPFGASHSRGRGEAESLFPDDFERILTPMGAQIVPVPNPVSFRKTVASLIDQISASR